MDCSPPGSSVHGIFWARVLKRVSKEPAWPRNQTHLLCVSCIGRRILFHWYTLYETELAASSQLLSWHCSALRGNFPNQKEFSLQEQEQQREWRAFTQTSGYYTKVALQFHPTQRLRCVDDSKQGRKMGDTSISQWHPAPVLLPGKSHGQRSLVGCSPWGG